MLSVPREHPAKWRGELGWGLTEGLVGEMGYGYEPPLPSAWLKRLNPWETQSTGT